MDSKTAYSMLREAQHLNPDYIVPKKHSTFLLLELVEADDATMELITTIVDEEMAEWGGAEAYLALRPQQRTLIELARLIAEMIPSITAIACHVPPSKELRKHGPLHICEFIRNLTTEAAITALTQPDITILYEHKK